MKPTKVVIQDSPDLKNIFVQVSTKKGTTLVFSNFSAWENLAYLMEALALTAEQCITEGIPRAKVYGAIKKYFMRVLGVYTVTREETE